MKKLGLIIPLDVRLVPEASFRTVVVLGLKLGWMLVKQKLSGWSAKASAQSIIIGLNTLTLSPRSFGGLLGLFFFNDSLDFPLPLILV